MKIKKRPSMRTLTRHVEAGSDSGYCTRCWTRAGRQDLLLRQLWLSRRIRV